MAQSASETSFSMQMRRATRDVHRFSDALVNAKLAFALSDDAVWAEGLLVFYEVFKYLEENVPPDLLPREFHRIEAFESDLSYYLGPEWKRSYEPRKVVQTYVTHLKEINETKPILLLAYVYHLYMGLLSGGQVLQRKRSFAMRLNPVARNEVTPQGSQVIYFGRSKIADLKHKMRNLVDTKAREFDEQLKQLLIEESHRVFELNNEIVRSVKGVNQVNLRKVLIVGLFAVLTYFFYQSIFR